MKPENQRSLKYYLLGIATAALIALGLDYISKPDYRYISKPDYRYELKRIHYPSKLEFSTGYWRYVNGVPWGGTQSFGARVDRSFDELSSEWLSDSNDLLGFLRDTMKSESGIDPNEPISELEISIRK